MEEKYLFILITNQHTKKRIKTLIQAWYLQCSQSSLQRYFRALQMKGYREVIVQEIGKSTHGALALKANWLVYLWNLLFECKVLFSLWVKRLVNDV